MIRDFIELLDIVYQNPQINVSEFIANDSMEHAKAEDESDVDEEFAEFEL